MYGGSHIIFPPTKIKELKGIQVTRHMPMIMFQEIYIVLYVHLASFLRQGRFHRYPLIFQEYGVNITNKSDSPNELESPPSTKQQGNEEARLSLLSHSNGYVMIKWNGRARSQFRAILSRNIYCSSQLPSRYVRLEITTIIAQLTSLLPHSTTL